MEIVLDKKDELNALLKVNMSEDDYKPKVNVKLKEYSKTASLKGFRPGKVPTALIEKMYGKSIMVDEINNLLSSSIMDYIKTNKIEILGEPLPLESPENPIDWETQKSFEFNYEIGLVPAFSTDFKTYKINKSEIIVDKEAINTTLNNVKKQFGKSVDADTVAKEDVLYCEITPSVADEAVKGELHLERVQAKSQALFVGKKKSETVEADITKLFDEAHVLAHLMGLKTEEAAGLVGNYKFNIININRKEDAELNQELFDKMFGKDVVTDEAAFMAKLEETIKENYAREAEYLLNHDIKKAAIEHTSFDLPKEFIKKWLSITNKGKITTEELDSEIDNYVKELKWNLIKNKIAQDYELKVSNDEVMNIAKDNLKRQFGGMEFTPEMETTIHGIVENQLRQDEGKEYMRLHNELLSSKVFALVSSQISLTDKKITIKEFEKLVSE